MSVGARADEKSALPAFSRVVPDDRVEEKLFKTRRLKRAEKTLRPVGNPSRSAAFENGRQEAAPAGASTS